MNSKVSIVRSVAVAVALVAGLSGMARADDSSTNPFTGDSYASFNGGNVGRITKPPVFVAAPSSWRRANPNGLSDRQLQALSSEALGNSFQRPNFDTAPSSFAQTHPHGLSERELQALSSPGPAWHSAPQTAPSALAIIKFLNRASN
jgi:hypothetical protein